MRNSKRIFEEKDYIGIVNKNKAIMAMKQYLSQKLEQRLSPQQIQLMKLLQVPTMELDARIKQEIEENPALEEGADKDEDEFEDDDLDDKETEEDFDISDYLDDDADYKTRVSNKVKTKKKRECHCQVLKVSKSVLHNNCLSVI